MSQTKSNIEDDFQVVTQSHVSWNTLKKIRRKVCKKKVTQIQDSIIPPNWIKVYVCSDIHPCTPSDRSLFPGMRWWGGRGGGCRLHFFNALLLSDILEFWEINVKTRNIWRNVTQSWENSLPGQISGITVGSFPLRKGN